MYKNIKVGIKKSNKNTIFYKIIWKNIKNYLLTKNYIIEYLYIEENKLTSEIIDDINHNVYDLVIEPLYQTTERLDKINYTYPFLLERSSIVFKPKRKSLHIIYFLNTIIPIIILLLLLSIFSGYILNLFNNKEIKKQFYFTFLGFFGQTGGLLNYTDYRKPNSIFLCLLLFIIIFFTTVLLISYITAKVVVQTREFKTIRPLNKKKILIQKNITKIIKKELQLEGGILIEKNYNNSLEILDYFVNNQDIENCYIFGVDLEKININKEGQFNFKGNKLQISEYHFHYHNVCFPVNKKHTKLLNDINYAIFFNFNNYTKLNPICHLIDDKDSLNKIYYC